MSSHAETPTSPDAGPPTCFTVEQANRMLPLVRRIVADLVTDYRRWQDAVHAADAGAPAARRLGADVEGYLGELAALGIECRGIADGLVDFPGVVDGEPVCLCWKLGEPEVAWWHAPEAGFAGRQPLAGVAR